MDVKEIDRYLYNEMSEREREQFEGSLVSDNDRFFEVVERENELVDLYTAGKLAGVEHEAFEKSLPSNPARRQKVSNASVIREVVSENRTDAKTITIAERTGFFATVSRMFSLNSPVLQFSSLGLILVLAAASIFLLVENRRLSSLERELASARIQESELNSMLENERETTGNLAAILTDDLVAERERIAKLEADMQKLRGSDSNSVSMNPSPTVATLVLSPVMLKGQPAPPAKRLDLPRGVSRVSLVIELPTNVGTHVSVELNDELFARAKQVRTFGGGKRITLVVQPGGLKDGRNVVEVVDGGGNPVGEYSFVVSTK